MLWREKQKVLDFSLRQRKFETEKMTERELPEYSLTLFSSII